MFHQQSGFFLTTKGLTLLAVQMTKVFLLFESYKKIGAMFLNSSFYNHFGSLGMLTHRLLSRRVCKPAQQLCVWIASCYAVMANCFRLYLSTLESKNIWCSWNRHPLNNSSSPVCKQTQYNRVKFWVMLTSEMIETRRKTKRQIWLKF